jgi:lactoylglutathione lyase
MFQQETTTRMTDVRTVGVPVTNQDGAVEFCVAKLGFEKRLDAPIGDGMRRIEVAPPGATTTIALVQADDGLPTGIDTGIRLNAGDADADHTTLRTRGVDSDDVRHWPGVPPMFTFRDQDHNRLYVVGSA